MNPVEKLVRRIRAALKDRPDDATLQGLSREYARYCEEVNLRLEQCAEMLRRQNEYQALELAEARPPVLDLVTILSFEEAEAWRSLCQKEKLAVPESLDEKAVRKVNELYAKGISANHPLYKQYRETMLSRDFPAALQVLRSITKLNPKDRNARQELDRLEAKVLALKLESLREPLDFGLQDAVADIMADIENIPWSKAPAGELWEKALEERKKFIAQRSLAEARTLLHQMEDARRAEKWEQVQDHLYTLQSKQQESGASWPADLTEKEEAFALWAANRKEHEAEKRELEEWLAAWPDLEPKISRIATPDLKKLEQLLYYWLRDPEEGSLPMPEEDRLAADQARRRLRSERKKRQSRLLLLRGGLAALGLAVTACIAFVVWGHSRVNSALSHVNNDLELGQITLAEARLNQLEKLQKWVPGARSSDGDAVQEVRDKIAQARVVRGEFETALGKMETLAAAQFANSKFRDVGKDYETYSNLRGSLAVEFRDQLQGRCDKVDQAWNQFLDQARQSSIARLQTLVSQSEDLIKQKLDFKGEIARVREAMKPLAKNTAEMEEFLSPLMSGLRLPPDLTEKARKITYQVKPFEDALQAVNQTTGQLRAAGNLDDYLAAVKTLSASPFSSSRETEAALNLSRKNPNLTRLSTALLAPKFPNPPFPLQRSSIAALFPEGEPTEKERTVFLDLRDDQNLGEIYRCHILSNDSNSRWRGDLWVFSRGEPKNKESRISGEILRSEWKADLYDPATNPESAGFDSATLTYSYTAKPPSGSRIAEQIRSVESDFFSRIGLNDLIDPKTGKYRQSILKILDTLRSDPALNPLFCAYVHTRLVALASDRPDSWGLSLSPSLEKDCLEIQKVFTSEPFSSDWMVPKRVQAAAPRLKKIFDSSRSISYLTEAMLLREYYQRIGQTGFRFAGYVDENNSLQGNQEAKNALELWGWDDKEFVPTLLFQRTSPSETWRAVRPAAMLSPLFSCPLNREAVWTELVAAQKVDPQAPILNEYRPPFSRKNYER